jgi:N-acetylneuraminate synthase
MKQPQHTLIVAEAGVNHNGDLDLAMQLVATAADAGADYVKFQTFNARQLATKSAGKAEYQKATTPTSESQLDMLQRLELSHDAHHRLVERCNEKGIGFLSTAFDLESLDFLAQNLKLNLLKLGSGELTNAPILLAAARSGMQLMLSTGMGTLAEVEEALGVLAFGMTRKEEPKARRDFASALLDPSAWAILRERVTLLPCTTEYPAAVADTNLRAMDTMRVAFGLPVGYSDHTEGNGMSLAAVARGAVVIEKHFTLDRGMEGPDHAASIEPHQLASLVADVRAIEAGLGDGRKQPGAAELRNRAIARKCVVAARNIAKGQIFSADDLASKRGGGLVSAMSIWDMVGRAARRDYAADEPLDEAV